MADYGARVDKWSDAFSRQFIDIDVRYLVVVPAGLFWRGANDRVLQPGEVLTRIRIPLAEAEHGQYVEEQVQWRGETARVGFAAVAALHKGAVEEFRLCVSSPWFGTLRFGDLESACVGLRPPLRDRTVEDLLSVLRRSATQRLAAPITEVAAILAAILRQTGRILRLLDRSVEEEPPGLRRIARPAAAGGAAESREP